MIENQKLMALLDISKALGSEIQLSNLLNLILKKTTAVMEAERSTLFLYDPIKKQLHSKIAQGMLTSEIRISLGVGIAGDTAKTRKLINIPDAYKDPRFDPEIDKTSHFHTKSVLCLPLFDTNANLLGVIQVLNKKSGSRFTKKDEELLKVLGAQAAVAIERAQLIESHIEMLRMDESLNLAREIQSSFLPGMLPLAYMKKVDIHAVLHPAKLVGGDLYDFFLVDHDTLFFAIADVSGKGVPASLFMAVTSTLLKAHTEKDMSPAEILTKTNINLGKNNDANMFVTCFCGLLKFSTGELIFSNAGHNYPYIIHSDQTIDTLKSARGNIPLAIKQNERYFNDTVYLKKGDILLLFTDGVTEAMNSRGEQFTCERLETFLKSQRFGSSQNLVNSVLEIVHEFVDDALPSDDIALLALHPLH